MCNPSCETGSRSISFVTVPLRGEVTYGWGGLRCMPGLSNRSGKAALAKQWQVIAGQPPDIVTVRDESSVRDRFCPPRGPIPPNSERWVAYGRAFRGGSAVDR